MRQHSVFGAVARRVAIAALALSVLVPGLAFLGGVKAPALAQDVLVVPKADSAAAIVHPNLFLPTPSAATGPVQDAMLTPPPMRTVPGMMEPLVATGAVTPEQDTALDAALAAYQAPTNTGKDFPEQATPLLAYLKANPGSAWNMALLTNLGIGYYHAGYFSRAFAAWEQAWQAGRNATTPQAKALTDRAVGELARMHARVGHKDELVQLFAEVGDRPIGGPATEMFAGAHEGLWSFQNDPGKSYLCGPKALKKVLTELKATPAQIKIADEARSGPHGVSLPELSALATKAGLDHRLIFRAPGQPVPVPSVINWNVHHYAALTGMVKDRYRLQDPTFGGGPGAVTMAAIDAESSGYFLVPAAQVAANPKNGWRVVDPASPEAQAVYGMGIPTEVDSGITKPSDPKIGICDSQSPNASVGQSTRHGMCAYNAHIPVVSLNLTDTPVGYAPPKGPPVYVALTYNQREAMQPASFSYFNIGPKWTLNWISYVTDDPASPGYYTTRNVGGGGGEDYTYYSTGADLGLTELDSGAFFIMPTTAPIKYERRLPDGSKEVYAKSDGAATYPRRVFLSQVVDPAGNTVTLNYDASLRVTTITDATGRNTTFSYGVAGYPLLVSAITDPFGRVSNLTYYANGTLHTITDVHGITSTFGYDAGGLVNSLATPYGTTGFAYGQTIDGTTNYRWLEATDPMSFKERVEYWNGLDVSYGIPGQEPAALVPTNPMDIYNDYINGRNAFHWDKHMLPIARPVTPGPIDYTKSWITHFTHDHDLGNSTGNAVESKKNPLENRVWYNYPGQNTFAGGGGTLPWQTVSARVLDDGTTQVAQQSTYSASGLPLTRIDGVGRKTVYSYAANAIDLSTIQQQTSTGGALTTVAGFSNYNALHEPQTITDAAGQNTLLTYNAAGQILTVKNPLLQTVVTNTYDTKGRLSTVKNANNVIVLTYNYPTNCDTSNPTHLNCDLPASIKDTSATSVAEPNGRTVSYLYDPLDRVTKITYPDGTHDDFDYKFQSGPNVGTPSLELRKVTDRQSRVTIYDYDADRRRISVTEPLDASTTRTTQYQYYENGVLKNLIDANSITTHWDIDLQSRQTAKTYAYGTPQAKTETYTYETTTSRLKKITDAKSQVKTVSYNKDDSPSGIAYTASVIATPNVSFAYDPFWPRKTSMTDGTGTTTYTYKAAATLGALKLDTENGPFTSNDSLTYGYDAVGRPNAITINGGNEIIGYDAIGRINSHGTPLGTFTKTYLGETSQPASQSVTNASITVSTGWGYDTNLHDLLLKTITNSGVTRSYGFTYPANPLQAGATNPYTFSALTDTAAATHPWVTQSHNYTYDYADRLLTASATTPGNNTYVYNKLDNPTTVTNPGSATVNPTYNNMNQLATYGTKTYTYDNNGNTTGGDTLKTYKWDAEDRLVEIDYVGGTNKTVFTYDGLGRRMTMAETVSGVTTTTRFMWCGERLCQSRTSADVVTARYMPEGEYIVSGTKKYVYMPDQLGSVRDVMDATTGARVAAIDYGPYGNRARTDGTVTPGYQYAGLFYHAASGLYLSATRAYDPATGRWLKRDGIRELGGLNLYGYGAQNPVTYTDPNGELASPIILPVAGIVIAGVWWEWAITHPNKPWLPNITPMVPVLTPAQELQKQAERNAYHKICDEKPPGNPDKCEDAKQRKDQAQQCLHARDRFNQNWYGGHYDLGHSWQQLQNWYRICNASSDIQKYCPQ